ncbi:hypothetical protein P5705_21445 [Pseudomonas entomophila]|uniref:hypothetical protein n=1 Tax=Pseudomonas entomophila TaxID=312306 RepID=UPI00240743FC|nr:hypothetical protein [Pseudomonas entomophila]MDF9620221.1 hypothetical protein [Pseudomonas entomophila]
MQPEHFDFASPIYLPVTAETCEGVLQGEVALESLSGPELAAILVIQKLPMTGGKVDHVKAEVFLGKLIAWDVDGKHSENVSLLSEARRLYDARKLYFGLDVLKASRVRFLESAQVLAREYLLPSGKWDFCFRVNQFHARNPFSQQVITGLNRERWLTTEQDKLLRTLRANLDEHLDVQGYAGIGKSHLLGALKDILPKGRVLILARTKSKLFALRKRIGAGTWFREQTFGEFAQSLLAGHEILAEQMRWQGKAQLAAELGILGFRHYEPEKAIDICLDVLRRYCESRDHAISRRHLPHFSRPLSSMEQQVLLEYTSRLWKRLNACMDWDRFTGFESLLKVKRASLAGCMVARQISHILIDESQDVPQSLMQIIERGKQALITLGDEYQKPKGPGIQWQREVRRRDVAFSVRSGPKVEKLINPLISQHSSKSKLAFEGAGSADVVIERFPEGFVPPSGCVILTASPWDTMKWAMELAPQGWISFSEDPGSATALDELRFTNMAHFMRSVVGLFRPDFYPQTEAGQEPMHPYFSQMLDWAQVRESNQYDESFRWVEAALESGFLMGDVASLCVRVRNHPSSLILIQAEDAGGLEFERVLLTPELMSVNRFKDAYAFDARICEVYIALSRARRQVYLPYDVEEWINYHKSQLFRELHGY